MNEDEYREKGREMTLNYLAENNFLIRVYGQFNASTVSINEYHDPSNTDPEHFHFESRHGFQFEFVSKTEAAATEL